MADTIFTTDYVSFWNRVRKGLLLVIVIVALVMSGVYLWFEGDFRLFSSAFIGIIGVIYVLATVERARTFVNEIQIADDQVIVKGYNYNTPWAEQFDLVNSEIRITAMRAAMGTMTCSLKFVSGGKSVHLDGPWDPRVLSSIFREFRRAKGEKITSQEMHFLARMEA